MKHLIIYFAIALSLLYIGLRIIKLRKMEEDIYQKKLKDDRDKEE